MSRTLVGIVSFGNLPFTRLTVESIRNSANRPIEFFMIVGKPGDHETIDWLSTQPDIKFKIHEANMGFPYSINDIYDYAWKENNFDNLIISGNDVVPYKYAIDSLIDVADTTEYEWICAREYSVKSLIKDYPNVKGYFTGEDLIFTDFNSKPWEIAERNNNNIVILPPGLSDVHNLALFKKSVMDKLGYIDVNFFPAYYSDNDYCRRAVISGIKSCTLECAVYFHFWSRTIKQGSGGSTSHYFDNNKKYYKIKWGGDFGKETKTAEVKISSRDEEVNTINYWKSM